MSTSADGSSSAHRVTARIWWAIRMALDRRTDVSRARRQLDTNEATVDNLRNSTLPALDLVGSYQLTGQGGPRRVSAGNSFEDISAAPAA